MSNTQTLTTIIMAGGLGKRMNSDIPKVLHLVKGKPMLWYVIKKALEVGSDHILIIVGKYKTLILKTIAKYFSVYEFFKFTIIDQEEPLGTGHAIQCCLPFFYENKIDPKTSQVLILSGDVPLIEKETIQQLLQKPNAILITKLENPVGCGRIIFRENNYIDKIIEEKDCTEEERNIDFVNAGIYHVTLDVLLTCLPKIENKNANQEYYLTDIVEIAGNLSFYELPREKQIEIVNINTPAELDYVNQNMK